MAFRRSSEETVAFPRSPQFYPEMLQELPGDKRMKEKHKSAPIHWFLQRNLRENFSLGEDLFAALETVYHQ